MMRIILTLFLLQSFAVWTWADTRINIPDPISTIKDLKDEVKKQSGYIIVIPYADKATLAGKLPKRLELNELLNWICRYYEDHNNIKLTYEFRNRSIFFTEIDHLGADKKNEILSRKISLVGKNMSIQQASKLAEKRANIKIILDIKDRYAARNDYNYRVSLGEFLEEVRNYYQRYNETFITYGIEKDAIRFYQQGKSASAKLEVTFLPEQVKKGPAPDLSPNKNNTVPRKIKKLNVSPPLNEEKLSFEDRFLKVKSFDLRDYFIPEKKNQLLIQMTEPQKREGRFKLYFKKIEPFLKKLKGFRRFKQNFLALDDYPMSDYQSNQRIEELESTWVQQLLGLMLKEKSKQPHPGDFNYIARAAFSTGKGATKVGALPTHRRNLEETATWFELGIGLEYHSKIQNLWIYEVKVDIDTAQGSNLAGEALEHSSFSASWEGNRQLAYLNLMSISPYLAYVRESDLGTEGDIQGHNLFISGAKLHWYEKANVLGFKQGLADSEFILSHLLPGDQEERTLVLGQKRDTTSIGLIQHFALIDPESNGYQGPSLSFGYLQRISKSDMDDGGEAFVTGGYLYVRGKWSSRSEVEYASWSRDQNVDQLTLLQEFSISPWLKGENFKLSLEYESSNSDDLLMDYSSKLVKLGFEKKW